MRKILLVSALIVSLFLNRPSYADDDYDPQHTMLALNMAIVSVHKILSAQDRIILDQEYQNIINNLSIGNIKSDPEITELYNKMIDVIGQKRLQEEETKQVKARYDLKMQNLFASSLSRVSDNTELNNAGFWGCIANMLYASVASYFRYEANGNEVRRELSENLYALKAEDTRNFTEMQKQLLSSSWNLMYKYHLPDEYRLVQKAMDDFYRAIEEPDEAPRRLRMLRALEDDFKVYPPYWYYRARTAQEAGDQAEADKCFDRFDEVWRPVLRRDPYKLEVTKYRLTSLVKNGVPESGDVREEALRLLEVMRKNTLLDDWTNNLFAGTLYYSFGDKENGIKCVETNVDFKYETDISLAMLQQMKKGVKPSDLASDTLRGRKLNDLVSGMDSRDKEAALLVADYFDGREGDLSAHKRNSDNPLILHTRRIIEFMKADTSAFRNIYDIAQKEIASKDRIPALYSGVLKMVESYADDGNTPAQIFLADMYNYGWGVQKDVKKAMKYYVRAGNSKDVYSQFMYINLMLGSQDYSQPEAKRLETQQNTASDLKSADKIFDLGMLYYSQKNYEDAIQHFQSSAMLGHAGASFMIGQMFENGQGRAKNPAAARSWYQEAANRGHDGAKKALERLTEKKSNPWW